MNIRLASLNDLEQILTIVGQAQKWLAENKYISIHRIAVEESCKNTGAASQIIDFAQKFAKSKSCTSLRVDTHEDNIVMQKFLLKNNFTYCGIIYLQDKAKRLAYEKVLTDD